MAKTPRSDHIRLKLGHRVFLLERTITVTIHVKGAGTYATCYGAEVSGTNAATGQLVTLLTLPQIFSSKKVLKAAVDRTLFDVYGLPPGDR